MFCTQSDKMCRIVILISIAVSVIGCHHKSDEAVWASYGESQLFGSDVARVVPENLTPEDSVAFTEKFIKDWLVRQIILEAAENGLSDEQLSFDQMVEEYSNSLKIHAFEEEWLKQKLDTVVSDMEIQKYYEDNISNFELKQFLVKIKFTSVGAYYRQLPALKKLFYSDRPEDIVRWQQACVTAGATHFLSEEEWMTWDEFLKQVPLDIVDVAAFLKRQRPLEFEKGELLYLIRFMEYKLSGSVSPIEFERDRIINLILNRRKRLLLDQMRNDLYAKAEAEERFLIQGK